MSARDAQPLGILQVTARDLKPGDRVLGNTGRLHELVATTPRLLDPSPWQTEDDDGYRLILEWLGETGLSAPMVRPTTVYLLAIPVMRA